LQVYICGLCLSLLPNILTFLTALIVQHNHMSFYICCSHGCCRHVLVQVYGYALYKSGKYACVKYPMEGYSEDVAGRSFHHGRFVQRLRYKAAAVDRVTVREGTVRRLINGECSNELDSCSANGLEQVFMTGFFIQGPAWVVQEKWMAGAGGQRMG
jgi:hypothetical protein